MLPENLLEEIARSDVKGYSTAFTIQLVHLAWPSLSVESRLEVIQAIQGRVGGEYGHTPEWLAELALTDPHPIVRYWAARRAHFFGDKGKAQIAMIESDKSEVVRACLKLQGESPIGNSEGAYKTLDGASHTARLFFFRNLQYPELSSFIEWLERAVAAGTSDRELVECALEYFESPRVKRSLKEPPVDGYDAYRRGEGMRKGWELVRRAELGLAFVLATYLPTKFGLDTMEAEELAQLPDKLLSHIIYRAEESKEAKAFLDLIQQTPEQFSEEVRQTARFMAEQLLERQVRQSPSLEKQEATIEAVLSLKREVSELRVELREFAEQAASRKRGLFW